MTIDALLEALSPDGHTVTCERGILSGFAATGRGEIAVVGTTDHLAMGCEDALRLASFVLGVVEDRPGIPILMLVDTQGQRLSKREELLGINAYLAHLVKSLELARARGHRLIALVHGQAVSGGFLSFGLTADDINALPDAMIRVMNLPAMARITRLPLDMLEELSVTSPWFAPGVDNFFQLGGVSSIWTPPLHDALEGVLNCPPDGDRRREDGLARQGRQLALKVSRLVSGEGA
jgi:malonate decarboxylase gamma subunit